MLEEVPPAAEDLRCDVGSSATWGRGSVGVVRVRLLPDRRWSQLVDTAVTVLDTVPVRHVVIDDVATRAGVSRSLVYRYLYSLAALLGNDKRQIGRPSLEERVCQEV